MTDVVIPNDKSSTQWILSDPRSKKLVCELNIIRFLIFRKAGEVLGHEDDVVHAPSNFGQVSFELGLSEVFLASFDDEFSVVFQSIRYGIVSNAVWEW